MSLILASSDPLPHWQDVDVSVLVPMVIPRIEASFLRSTSSLLSYAHIHDIRDLDLDLDFRSIPIPFAHDYSFLDLDLERLEREGGLIR
jgi:hypothetical protein